MNMPKALLTAASLTLATAAGANDILPADTPAATRQAIQNAIDTAGANGTVTLGNGIFEIDTQLMVTNGVTLAGKGWDHTVIKQVATTHDKNTRCVNVQGGATVEHVTLTGGSVNGNYESGGGAFVSGGTISWCCITNNAADGGNNKFGGGVSFYQGGGRIDHSIIANNLVRTTAADVARGGGIGIFRPYGAITIDSCLVYGNRAFTTGGKGQGGGISVDFQYQNHAVSIRNTTIIGNRSGDAAGVAYGGAIHTDNDSTEKLKMRNCIIAGNTTANGSTTVELSYSGNVDYCFFDVAGDKLGENSRNGDPQFVDAANGDYRLDPHSLAIFAGAAREDDGTDLDGVAFAPKPSMGCYEFTGTRIVNDPVFTYGTNVTFSSTVAVPLTCPNDGATIYYTTDGHDPTVSSTPYTAPIELSATKTIKAFAYQAGMDPSRIVTATYTRGVATPPVLGTVEVEPRATSTTISGEILSIGNNLATACDVYLAYSKRETNLGARKTIVSGATTSFTYVIPGLEQETTYYYELTIQNNAQTAMSASMRGSFTTTALGIQPAGDPAETWSRIQAAINAANLTDPAGTVYLASGLFEIDAQLMVTGGVTLVGRGMDRTIIKQTAATAAADKRVMTIDGGSKVEHLTITGGKVTGSNEQIGGGALVLDGTISWCCVTNNSVFGNNTKYGGGIGFYLGKGGQIDHCIVADNLASTQFGDWVGGGGIGVYKPFGPVTVESCLVYGNRAVLSNANDQRNHMGRGGGIGIDFQSQTNLVTIRNTTIAGNAAGETGSPDGLSKGGAVFTTGDSKSRFSMKNCLVAGNTTACTNLTMSLQYAGGVDYCLFDVADDKVGEHSKVGNPGFVNLAKGNCHLSPSSAAIGIGQWYEGIPEDLDGIRRRKKPAVGCYETRGGTILILR